MAIHRRTSGLHCNKKGFDKTKGIYEKGLNESIFKVTLNFNEHQSKRKNKNRKIVWSNSPYN